MPRLPQLTAPAVVFDKSLRQGVIPFAVAVLQLLEQMVPLPVRRVQPDTTSASDGLIQPTVEAPDGSAAVLCPGCKAR